MGYRIEYDSGSRKWQAERFRWGRMWAMAAVCLLLFLVLTNLFWPQGAGMLRRLLIPGDPEVTAQAFAQMVDGLRAGEDASECVTAFCREILENAQIPD